MSWLEEHLPDRLKDVLCEPDTPAAPQPVTIPLAYAQALPPSFIVTTAALPITGATTVTSSAVSSILSDLRSKTNFDATPVGQQLKDTMDALADSGMNDEAKVKTVMKLTKQSPAQVVSVLHGLQAVLVAEKQHFEASMQTATTAEVTARQTKAAQLASAIDDAESKLNAMRQEKSQLDEELLEKKNKISSARANYAAATEARNTELAEMISHYQSIPEGK